ncbi:MAG TPA: patatin-like phospholipase family protein [Myxococcaceae bacterium]|jgi:predicted acylesterase/phospholipase RssA
MRNENDPTNRPMRPSVALPPLHFRALSRWLEEHPDRLAQLFELKTVPAATHLFSSRVGTGPAEPRGLIVVSGELALTQLFPGAGVPHRALYRGDLWVNLNNPGSLRLRKPRASFRIEAIRPTEILLLSQQGLSSLPAREAAELEAILDSYCQFERARNSFFASLRKTVQYRQVSGRHLHALLDTVDVRTLKAGQEDGDDVVIPQGSTEQEHRGMFLVLDGHLGEWRDPAEDEDASSVLTRALYPGSLFGDVVMHSDAPTPSTVKLQSSEARVAFIPQSASDWLLRLSAHFAGSVSASPAETWERRIDVLPNLSPTPELVLFKSDAPDAPLEPLIQSVAEATHRAHGDHILRVDLVLTSTPTPPEPLPEWRNGEVPIYRLRVVNGQAAVVALEELAKSFPRHWDYFFVHVDPRLWSGLVPPENSARGFKLVSSGEVTWKMVFLSRDPLAAVSPPGFDSDSILYTALLDPGSEKTPGPILPAGTVRVRFDLPRFTSHRPFLSLPRSDQETFRRWGRAITERVVGVALGGGGAWGFAEVALLRGMLDRGIPVDVLSGTSFGAAVGAFYTGMGVQGMDLMLKQGHVFPLVMAASVISSTAIARYVDRMLGKQRLERVDIPFFPVGTNLSESQVFVRLQGTLGEGVRSSGIMPGLLSPDFTPDHSRICDGAFINSVPASVLSTQRANLTVAGNVLADPPDRKDPGPMLPGKLGLFLHGLNPFGRISDAVRASLILFNTTGENSGSAADILYNSPYVPVAPWSFSEGQAFVDAASSDMAPTLNEIEARWKTMAQRRGDILSLFKAKMPEVGAKMRARESA